VTNGLCPQVITRIWLFTDACGNTNTCSQTVTVVNTNPPVLTCAGNKTVPCGTAWSFDAPTAFDACCTNLTITVISTVTNGASGPCGTNYTRTWQATDCCTNTATCSQTVTVVNTLSPIVNVICVTNVYFAGGSNHFTTPVPSSPSLGLLARMQAAGITTFKQFDQCLINSFLIDTISNLPSCITSATLTMGLAPCGDNSANDIVNLSFTGAGGVLLGPSAASWSSYIGSGSGSPSLLGNTWDTSIYPNGQVITVDLGALGLIPYMNQYGFLDFTTQDDSGVDFLQLTVVSCCCSTNKTVPCGSGWNFDLPSAVDACSGAPVPATILSTVTNGLCPQVITRTWLFADACGNSNTCSQTVTVVNTQPPTLTCAGDKTVECGSPWTFDPPAATNACCGTNVTLTFFDVTNGPCPQAITRTWLAMDCCGNTNTCTQTVTLVAAAQTTVLSANPLGNPSVITVVYSTAMDPASSAFSGNYTLNALGIAIASATLDADQVTVQLQLGAPLQSGTGYNLTINNVEDASLAFISPNPTVVNFYFGGNPIVESFTGGTRSFTYLLLDEATTVNLGSIQTTLNGTLVPPTISKSGAVTTVSYTAPSCLPSPSTNVVVLRFQDNAGHSQTFTNIFILTASPPVLTCATNKTVDCGSPWTFDPPTASNACNVTISILSTVTNSSGCGYAVTRTWQATDCCTNSAICTQTVTVVSTQPPTLTCAGNKTVECGSPWTFDPPTATNACCGTNVTLTFFDVTTGSCPRAITRTWLATDCCGNTNTCTQTVTLVAAAQTNLFPPSGYASAQNIDSVTFTIPGTGTNITIRNFNLGNLLNPIAPPPTNGTAVYTNSGAVADFFVSDPSFGRLDWFPAQANGPIMASISHTSDTGSTSFFDTEMLQLDLSGASAFGPISLRESPTKQSLGRHTIQQTSQGYLISSFFDVFLELSTDGGVTWIPANQALHIQSSQPGSLLMNCAGDKTVPCGSPWAFDPPTATNACCGTNVTISILSTVTNGSGCGYAVTRSWQATDCCTNIATCTQTVTVVSTQAPVLTCAGDKTVQSGTVWTFDPPGVSAPCCSNLTLIAFPPQTNGNCCTQLISQVWQATCCTNSATCTQTVAVICAAPLLMTSPANKTVACGTSWDFDPPQVAATCCPTNTLVPVVLTTTVTNVAPCTNVYTRTWQVTDACGHTATSSQSVTVAAPPPGPVTIGIYLDAAGVHITFPTAPCYQYTVVYTDTLVPANWITLGTVIGDGLQYEVIDPGPLHNARFYRVIAACQGQGYSAACSSGMAPVPAGPFIMGDTFAEGSSDEQPTHTVNVSAFCMDTNLVSYTLWANVYQWATSHGYSFDDSGVGKAANHPVQVVNWYDVVKWCNARSEMEGLTPCYYTAASQATPYRSGDLDLDSSWVKWTANGYRLPTEAEWEKAARGGAAGHRFPWSDADTINWSRANYEAHPSVPSYDVNPTSGNNPAWTSGGYPYTSPVGSFAPNGYGLYDMAGNGWEWCWDWYGYWYYSSSPGTDPTGPAGSSRVMRGGSWFLNAGFARCAYRFITPPSNAFGDSGFRCVRGH
jgi:formylglycine-generating enzyme required for sulfatase activity